MEDRLKRRVIGASVVVALLVIFLPMLVDEEKLPAPPVVHSQVPPKPTLDDAARSRLLPDPAAPTAPVLPPKPPELGNGGRLEVPAEVNQPVTQKAPLLSSEPPPLPVAPPPGPSVASASTPPAPPVPERPASAKPAPAAPPAPSSGVSWVVQVAAYTETAKAEALAGRLNGKGFKAFVEPTLVNGKEYFRVRIGPDGDRSRMDTIAQQLAKELKVDAQVKRYP